MKTILLNKRVRSARCYRETKNLLLKLVSLAPLTFIHQVALAADAGTSHVEEVIVTAQRRSEKLEAIPMDVTALSADLMQKSGTRDLRDINQIAPGVLIANTGGSTTPAVRGVTSILGGNFYENNVAVYIDGIYQSNPININSALSDVANIQVLKGPQGTLYGRNATGGAIIITTKEPSKTWTGSFEAGYAEYNEKLFSGYISGPINDRVRFSVSGYSNTSDGYYKFSDRTTGLATDENSAPITKQSVRFRVQADLSDDLTATAGYNYSYFNDPTSTQYTPFARFSTTYPNVPLRSADPFHAISESFKPVNSVLTHDATLKLVWKTGIGTVTSASSYTHDYEKGHFDNDGSYVDIIGVFSQFPRDIYQTNLNYNITSIKDFDLLVGGTYYDQNLGGPFYSLAGAGNQPAAQINNVVHTKAYSGYVDGTYRLTDAFHLAAGVAYHHEAATTNYWLKTAAQIGTNNYTQPPVSKSATFKKVTPRASIRYEFAAHSNAYFSFTQGFKSGGWQTAVPPTVPFKPENITAYEVGIKTAQPHFHADAAAYYYDYTNIQTSVSIPDPVCQTPPNCGVRTLVYNGPSAHIYGADGQITWMPVDRLNLRVGLAYVHARYESFPNAVGASVNPANNTLVTGQVQDWSGLRLPRSPDFTGNFGADYDVLLPEGSGDILFNGNVTYTTKYIPYNPSTYGSLSGPVLARVQRYVQPAYALVSATATWTDASAKFSATLFVRNLTNHRYFLLYSSSTNFGDSAILGPPRVFGGSLRYSF